MANFASKDKDLRFAPAPAVPAANGAKPALRVALAALLAIVCVAGFVAGYFVLRPDTRTPALNKPISAAALQPKPISDRVQQARAGQFPTDKGILTFSKSLDTSDAEVRSIVGTYALPDYAAAQIESGESWGVTGVNRDEFVMYVHNFLATPLTAMVVRISEGSCASFGPQSATSWASAYWSEPLGGGKEAIFDGTLPGPYTLPSYCAVVFRVYSSRLQ